MLDFPVRNDSEFSAFIGIMSKLNKYILKFDKDFIQQKLNEGFLIRDISTIVDIPPRRLGELIKYYKLNYRRSRIPIEDIDNSGLYYVYRHRRIDDNSVFYIGIGNQPNHYRARTRFGRNNHWENIVNKYGFKYEVMYSKITREDAIEAEIFLISLYGRHDLGEGKLVNKTEGGDGANKYKCTDEERLKMSERLKLGGNPRAKKVIDTKTKIEYGSIKQAAIALSIAESTMRCYMNGQMRNTTNCVYLEEYDNEIFIPLESNCTKLILNLENGVFHYSADEACKCYNIKTTTMSGYLNNKFFNKTPLILV